MSQKPLPKIYDRPDRKMISPAALAATLVLLVIIAIFLTYHFMNRVSPATDTIGGRTQSQNEQYPGTGAVTPDSSTSAAGAVKAGALTK